MEATLVSSTDRLPLGLSDIKAIDTFLLLVAALVITFLILCVIFWAVPKGHMPWRDVWPGALFVTITAGIANWAFPFYLSNISSLSQFGSTLGFVLITLLWFYALSLALLAGAVINSLRHELHDTGEMPYCEPGGREEPSRVGRMQGVRLRPGAASAVALADDRPQLRAVVGRLDPAHGARARAHHQRLGRRPGAAVADALEDVAVGDAGGGEEDVLPRAEIVAGQHPVEVVAGVDRRLALVVVAGPEPSQQLAAHRLQRRRREHALGRAADPPEEIDRASGR